MGIAAYNRGTAAGIAADHRAKKYRCTCAYCWEAPAPTPRPANWGEKTEAKARKLATGFVRWCRQTGRTVDAGAIEILLRERGISATLANRVAKAIPTL